MRGLNFTNFKLIEQVLNFKDLIYINIKNYCSKNDKIND